MKTAFIFCALGMLALAAGQADASVLYGATSGGHGELYILNPATGGVLTDVGALHDAAATNYSVTGLAFDPNTGLLYGSTGGVSGTRLLTINPATALVTVIGSYGAGTATMTDLAFDPSGNLYGISSSGGANLYSINKLTGAATAVGGSGISFTEGGGLAISSGDVFYGTPIPGDYGTYNSGTGAYTNVGTPASPAGTGGSYAALAFAGNTLYGDNLLPGTGGGLSHLVTIDPATGTVTDIGPSVTHLDAIAVVPEPGAMTLLVGGVISLLATRRKRVRVSSDFQK
jgi:hypothetical protein